MRNPLLSVIVPIYNVEAYLDRCLKSICEQAYTNLEIICVDDGSTDDSGKILERWAKKDHRIVEIHKENQGLVSARKTAVKLATGKYITNVDSDDWIEYNMYSELMRHMLESEADVVISPEIRDYGKYTINTKSIFEPGIYEKESLEVMKNTLIDTDFFFRGNISSPVCYKIFLTKLYREKQLLVPDVISAGEDACVTYPYMFESNKVYITNKHYYHYCIRKGSMTSNAAAKDPYLLVYSSFIKESFAKQREVVKMAITEGNLVIAYANLIYNIEETVYYRSSFLYPYGCIDKNMRVVLYGAGKFGNQLYRLIKKREWFESVAWADKNGSNGAVPISEVQLKNVDKIIVAALHYDVIESIKEDILDRGFPEKDIMTVDIELIKKRGEV